MPVGMTKRIIALAVVAVVLLACGWFGIASAGPPRFHAYRKAALQAATAAHDAVRTSALTIGARLEHRASDAYTSVVLDDALGSVSSAEAKLDRLPPPDDRTTTLRDQLTPLLVDAVRQLGDVTTAVDGGDPATIRAAAKGLGVLGDRLDDYLDTFG
jgi:hypothetical protein